MLPRLSKAFGLACLAIFCFAGPTACSSSQRRDQWYGTDAGSDYQPEAGVFGNAGDGGDLDAEDGGDETASPDGQVSAETALDPGAEPDAAAEIDATSESDPNTVP